MRQQMMQRKPTKREETALWILENSVLVARHRGEPVNRSQAVSRAVAALVAVLDEELDAATPDGA